MLRWSGTYSEMRFGMSGDVTVAHVMSEPDGRWSWMLHIRPLEGLRSRGHRQTREQAQASVQHAWNRWLEKAALATRG